MRNYNSKSGIWITLALVCVQSSWGKMVENFEQPGSLGDRWTANQGMKLERVYVPPEVRHEGVERRMLQVDAVEGGYFASKPDFPRCRFHAATMVKFRVEAPHASAKNPMVFEFQVFALERKAWRWRKVTIDSPGWRTVELSTKYFRHSPAAYLPWEETRRFVFRFRNAGRLNLDTIELVDASFLTRPGELSLKEIAELAFGSKGKIHSGKHFAVLTDETRLKPAETLAALDQMLVLFLTDFPELKVPKTPLPLLIFSAQSDYQAFWGKLAEKFNDKGPVPESQGYTMLGIAGSYFDPVLGSVRPVYVHEACHALMTRLFGLASEGDWLHEGLANYYQLRWGKQDMGAIAKNLIAKGRVTSLQRLLDGRPIGLENYAQAALFIEWLMIESTRKARLLPTIRFMAKRCSTAFEPASKIHYGAGIDRIQNAWIPWLKTR